MAFVLNQLSKVDNLRPVPGATGSKQLFHYDAAADAVATVVADGYFNSARALLRVDDIIHVVAATGVAFRVLRVAAVPATGNITTVALAFS